MSQITAVQALVKVMKDWPEGEKLHGYQIHDRVIRTLKQNGFPRCLWMGLQHEIFASGDGYLELT